MIESFWDRLKDEVKEAVVKKSKEYPSFEKLQIELQEVYSFKEVSYFAYRDLRDISKIELNKDYKDITHLVDFLKED